LSRDRWGDGFGSRSSGLGVEAKIVDEDDFVCCLGISMRGYSVHCDGLQ
jgi:hypothetical protein